MHTNRGIFHTGWYALFFDHYAEACQPHACPRRPPFIVSADRRNETAFNEISNILLPKLYPFLLKLTKSESAIQDLIQETFLKIWLNRDKLAEMDNPGGWIYRVVSNKCYDYLKDRTAHNQLLQPMHEDTEIQAAFNDHHGN